MLALVDQSQLRYSLMNIKIKLGDNMKKIFTNGEDDFARHSMIAKKKDFTQTNQTQAIELLNKEVADLREDLKWCHAEIPALKKVIREMRLFKDINVRTRCADRLNS